MVSDIAKILERVPLWLQRASQSDHVDRNNFIEPGFTDVTSFGGSVQQTHQPTVIPQQTVVQQFPCDSCFTGMELVGVEKLDDLDVFGQVIHTLECPNCGLVTQKIYTTDEGYL